MKNQSYNLFTELFSKKSEKSGKKWGKKLGTVIGGVGLGYLANRNMKLKRKKLEEQLIAEGNSPTKAHNIAKELVNNHTVAATLGGALAGRYLGKTAGKAIGKHFSENSKYFYKTRAIEEHPKSLYGWSDAVAGVGGAALGAGTSYLAGKKKLQAIKEEYGADSPEYKRAKRNLGIRSGIAGGALGAIGVVGNQSRKDRKFEEQYLADKDYLPGAKLVGLGDEDRHHVNNLASRRNLIRNLRKGLEPAPGTYVSVRSGGNNMFVLKHKV